MTVVIQVLFERDRRDRMNRLWTRFAEAMSGEPCPKPATVSGIARRIRMYLVRGEPANWTWHSAIEFAEIANQKGPPLPFTLQLDEPEPVRALAGSDDKIAALARRMEEGQELFCKGDGPGVMVRVEN